MQISKINIKYPILAIFATCSIGVASALSKTNLTSKSDTFEYVIPKTVNPVDKYTQADLPAVFRETVNPSSWTNDPEILKNAPDPTFRLLGQKKLARGVVDISNCRFYVYDDKGKAIESFKVATGKKSTPTTPGIRKVLSKMTYPYSNCPKSSKRYRFPADYGPKLAYLNIVDTITGTLRDNGAYLHGTRHESAVAREYRHLTHGCVRVHNRDALYIVNDVLKVGDFLKFVK